MLIFLYSKPQRQPQEPSGNIVSYLQTPSRPAKLLTARRGMEGHVVEDGVDPDGFQFLNRLLPITLLWQQDVIQMAICGAIRWNGWQMNAEFDSFPATNEFA